MRGCTLTASLWLVCCLSMGLVASASGQSGDSAGTESRRLIASTAWVPASESRVAPLRRAVALDIADASVKSALQAIRRAADLEIVFGDDVLAARARVSLHVANITVLDALSRVLEGTGLEAFVSLHGDIVLVRSVPVGPRAAGTIAGRVTDAKTQTALAGATVVVEGTRHSATSGDDGRYRIAEVAPGAYTVRARYIGFAPRSTSVSVSADLEATADFTLEKSAQRLDEVVTTGTITPTEQKAVPNPVSVVTGDEIAEQNLHRVDQIFRGMVPGSAGFDPGVLEYVSSVNLRGANQLTGYGWPKIYVDGVEIADQFGYTLANLDPGNIERIEVIRGPEGSTVYGSNASGGVIQVFTKKGAEASRPELVGKVLVGVVQAPFAPSTPVRQDYSLALTGGKTGFSYNLGGSFQHTGETAPAYYSRTPSFVGGASLAQGPVTVELTARWEEKTWADPFDPRLAQFTLKPDNVLNQYRHEGFGLTVSYRASPRWQQNLILGYDANAFPYWQTEPTLKTPADTFLFVSTSDASRASIRYNTSYELPLGPAVSLVTTAGAEYTKFTYASVFSSGATTTNGFLDGTTVESQFRYGNTGYFGQIRLGIRDQLFLTGGLRAERNDNFGAAYGTAWQPRVGASYVQSLGGVSVKLRGSWGNAIRAVDPEQAARIFRPQVTNQLANPALAPERQSGWDAGVDLQFGSRASLGVTYYDQDVKDLIDQVTLSNDSNPPLQQYQNTGLVKNRGWEFDGQLQLGRVSVTGTFSPVSSTVRKLSPTYGGDLQVGDQVIGPPRRSGGATLRWTPTNGTTAIVGMTYLGGWTNYDWLALFDFFYGVTPFRGSMRDYWLQYPSITKFNLSLSQRLTRQVSALVQVDNLGNNQRYELSNLNMPIGRVTSVGFRFQY